MTQKNVDLVNVANLMIRVAMLFLMLIQTAVTGASWNTGSWFLLDAAARTQLSYIDAVNADMKSMRCRIMNCWNH